MNTGVPWPNEVVETTVAWARVLAMQTKLHRWAAADPGRRFDDVFNLVHDPAFLMAAWDRVRGNKGGRTAGVDGVVPRFIAPGDVTGMLADLRQQLKSGEFTPLPVRERRIPKAGGKTRSLGIPTTTDRIVQASLKLVLEPIFEADFEPSSYGFRPRRRAQDAVAEIHYYTTGNRSYEWVFEGDIKARFVEIDHTALMERVRGRIADKRALALIRAFLKAGVLTEDGLKRDTRTGTPQGGILSPLLANVALSVLDEHFRNKWEALGPEWMRVKHRRAGGATMKLIRYADDFVVLVHGSRDDAEALFGEVTSVLAPMGLRLSEEKTHLTHIADGFDFLGWRIQRRTWQGRGGTKQTVYTYPSKKALASIKAKIRLLTRRKAHRTLADLLRRLNPAIRGWCNYFQHGVSKRTFGYVDHFAFWRVVRWLMKRHPKLNKHTVIRRFLPGWHIAADGIEFFRAWQVPVTRYRYRGTKIPNPWMPRTSTTAA
ncbi:MAG: group II intron reverse transcriptase/maturase [Nocardioides sp.]